MLTQIERLSEHSEKNPNTKSKQNEVSVPPPNEESRFTYAERLNGMTSRLSSLVNPSMLTHRYSGSRSGLFGRNGRIHVHTYINDI